MTDTFESTFRDIFDEAFNLLVERQKKYGPENIKQLGLYGVFSRLASDKIERIRRSFNGKLEHGEIVLDDLTDFGDESVDDALLDIANYALIMLALKRGVWGRPLAQEGKSGDVITNIMKEIEKSTQEVDLYIEAIKSVISKNEPSTAQHCFICGKRPTPDISHCDHPDCFCHRSGAER